MQSWLENTLRNEYQFVRMIHKSERAELLQYRSRADARQIAVRRTAEPVSTEAYDILKRVRHRNLLEIYDTVQLAAQTVILEEYIDGITLAETAGAMSPEGVRRVLLQLCEGLSALHGIGIVHRDVTLSNIMLTADGTLKLIDYDIAKVYRTDGADPDTRGTVGYAPFEQYGIGTTDERTDIFAVGVTANLLLTGRHPSAERYQKGRLGRMIAVCTSIDPNQRFAHAADLIRFLQ